jgi:hypothetical protein
MMTLRWFALKLARRAQALKLTGPDSSSSGFGSQPTLALPDAHHWMPSRQRLDLRLLV